SVRIPINLAYTFTISGMHLGVFAGPALDYSFAGKIKTKEENRTLQFGDTKNADLKPFDLGVNIGLMAEYKNVFFSINAVCGTLDRRSIRSEGESAVYQNNVLFSMGYFFRRK
ncbi:MAG: PorT family protein, partial [Tannerellaceae bacterium]